MDTCKVDINLLQLTPGWLLKFKTWTCLHGMLNRLRKGGERKSPGSQTSQTSNVKAPEQQPRYRLSFFSQKYRKKVRLSNRILLLNIHLVPYSLDLARFFCFICKKERYITLRPLSLLSRLYCSYYQCSGSVTFWYGSGSADPYSD